MQKKIPLRKCIGCGEIKPKKEMMRIVKMENNEVKLDKTGKLNGRGAYICSLECIKNLKKKKLLDRAFEMKVKEETYENIEKDFTNDKD